MLEVLLLTVIATGAVAPSADRRTASPPSLELLEFLGEFGDDEGGLFDNVDTPREPGRDSRVAPTPPATAPPVSSPAPVPSPPPPASKVSP